MIMIIFKSREKKRMGFLNETVCVWCKSKTQSGLKYFESGDSASKAHFV